MTSASDPSGTPTAASQPKSPLLHKIGGVLLAWLLPPAFAVVAVRRWKDVPSWLRIASTVLSFIAFPWMLLEACAKREPEFVPVGLLIVTWASFAAAYERHKYGDRRPSLLLKSGGLFIISVCTIPAVVMCAYPVYSLACTGAALFIGAAVAVVYMRRSSAPPDWLLKWVAGYAGILGGIILVITGIHIYFYFEIKSSLAAVHKAGFPVTLQELSDYYPTPPSAQNAAGVYMAAFGKYVRESADLPFFSEKKLPPRGEPLPESIKGLISSYLAENAQALPLLHKAAAMERCRFPLDFSQGYLLSIPPFGSTLLDFSQGDGILIPEFGRMRHAARLLKLEALMKVEEGKPEEAGAAVAASLSVARSLRYEPVLWSQMERIAVDSISISTLERVLSRTALADGQLAELSKALASEENLEGLTRIMAGERCTGNSVFDLPLRREIQAYGTIGIEGFDHVTFLRLMAELVGACQGSAKEMRERVRNVENEISKIPRLCLFTRMVVRALPDACTEELKEFARLRAARTAIAIERFRMANGRLPDSLDELVPKWLDAVPENPFDDRPIQYTRLDRGFTVYSAGPEIMANWNLAFTVAR